MKAAVARLLKVGDTVGATFGNYRHKDCIILSIDWPVFTLKWKDYRGQWKIRTRRYESIFAVTPKPNAVARDRLPSWLKYD